MAEEESAQNQQPAQQFALQRIYVKDISFETPQGHEVFRQAWKPRINLEMNTRQNRIDEQNYEVVLTLSVTAHRLRSIPDHADRSAGHSCSQQQQYLERHVLAPTEGTADRALKNPQRTGRLAERSSRLKPPSPNWSPKRSR